MNLMRHSVQILHRQHPPNETYGTTFAGVSCLSQLFFQNQCFAVRTLLIPGYRYTTLNLTNKALSQITIMLILGLLMSSMPVISSAYPHNSIKRLSMRQALQPDNTVRISGPDNYCLVMPRFPHTNVGDSEYVGGTQVFCSSLARTADEQGLLPGNFWRNVEFHTGQGGSGENYVQLTGCIRPSVIDRLNVLDEGGQYDSSGGPGGRGNPRNSGCVGYNHYVELVEPAINRACC